MATRSRIADRVPELPADSPWSIVLGIDPGTLVVGYGAVVPRPRGVQLLACGAIRAPRRESPPQRLGYLRDELDELLRRLRPEVVVVETGYTGDNPQSALRVGEGRGVALACAASAGALVIEVSPALAKKTLVGNGQADKQQVAAMVAAELGLPEPPSPLDATDALALALTHLARRRLDARLATPAPRAAPAPRVQGT